MMVSDTGVGKTLLAGGTMRHFMKTRETSDATTSSYLFHLKGYKVTFKEMKEFMADYDQVKGRIMEMNYTKFAKIVRGIDRIEETMKMTDAKSKSVDLETYLLIIGKTQMTLAKVVLTKTPLITLRRSTQSASLMK